MTGRIKNVGSLWQQLLVDLGNEILESAGTEFMCKVMGVKARSFIECPARRSVGCMTSSHNCSVLDSGQETASNNLEVSEYVTTSFAASFIFLSILRQVWHPSTMGRAEK